MRPGEPIESSVLRGLVVELRTSICRLTYMNTARVTFVTLLACAALTGCGSTGSSAGLSNPVGDRNSGVLSFEMTGVVQSSRTCVKPSAGLLAPRTVCFPRPVGKPGDCVVLSTGTPPRDINHRLIFSVYGLKDFGPSSSC